MDKFKAVGRFVATGVQKTGSAATSAADTVAKRGKLAFVSKVLGRVDETHAPEFDHRSGATDQCQKILKHAHQSFERVSLLFEQLSLEVARVSSLLEEFQDVIDPCEARMSREGAADDANSPGGTSDAAKVAQLTAEMQEQAERLVKMAQSAGETLKFSCVSIVTSSVKQAKKDAAEARSSVRDAQVALDLARNDVVAAQEELETIEATLEEFREANGTVNPRTIDSLGVDPVKARQTLDRREAALENRKAAYDSAVIENVKRLDHSLEQTTMAGWSSFNVFFTEVSNFLAEGAPVANAISQHTRSLKNLQGVSKQLTRERRVRLAQELQQAALRSAGTSPAGPTVMTTATGGHAPTATSFFDDPVETATTAPDAAGASSPDERPAPKPTARPVDWDELFA
eukprot:CAMPEP_0174850860 /NCGR_PEP_ID=MMETSP1114-20130205/21173_1 /TAXON_ID=312471 /ORGANISM="Neobodo designis, Strain CCAP 1951/1" /LENGTH=400 /DNA_ID=CAMNT_0016085351 /DNA_START=39 /DNA_END=1241 /DNA_ORIENTATION=+